MKHSSGFLKKYTSRYENIRSVYERFCLFSASEKQTGQRTAKYLNGLRKKILKTEPNVTPKLYTCQQKAPNISARGLQFIDNKLLTTWWLLDKARTYFQQESLSIKTP